MSEASSAGGGPPDFEAMYAADRDPWRVASSFYEQRKLGVVTAVLGRPRYAFAWDAACGTGHLAARLARRARAVLATDASARAVELTAELCADLPVQTRRSRLPESPGRLDRAPDLVVLSEVFYYLDDRDRCATVAMVDATAAPSCELVAVHWKGVPEDAWLSGLGGQQQIVSRFAEADWHHATHHDDAEFVIDTLWREPDR